jgi:oligogalacturonide lyase
MDILEFQTRKLGSIPALMGQATLSHDLKSLAFGRRRDEKNWDVVLLDLATGAWRTVASVGFQIGHVQHSPTHPQIFYTWETSGYAPQRSWIVDDDGTANRPFYHRTDPKQWWTPLKEWMTHESWIQSSGEMTMIMDKIGIVLVDPGGASKLLINGNYWHTAARSDGKFLVADDFDGRLWLIEAATGNTRLMMTGIRKTDRAVHAHASLDREGGWLFTNTSARGRKTVALVEVR